jgi:hypothetical protein
MHLCIVTFLFCQPIPSPPLASFNPSYTICPPVYLLGDPSYFARGANTHPLLPLVGYQLSSPCCLTHPEGTPQIKLHIYIDNINNISRPGWYNYYPQHYHTGEDILYIILGMCTLVIFRTIQAQIGYKQIVLVTWVMLSVPVLGLREVRSCSRWSSVSSPNIRDDKARMSKGHWHK